MKWRMIRLRPTSSKTLDRNWEQTTSEYIEKHRIEEILEPILTSLIIGAPILESPKNYIKQNLLQIKQNGIDATTWKSFIPDETVPEKLQIPVKYHDLIERIDNFGPCDEEHYRAAFNFRYLNLKKLAMNMWMEFVERQKEERRIEKEKTEKAVQHYENRNLKRNS